jgi:hypothetical protein
MNVTMDPFEQLAEELRGEGPILADRVVLPSEPPAIGLLAASGPRTAKDADQYAFLVEAVREGFLCHYGEPRLLLGLDSDLRLLVGDYLYARGIERLARLGDLLAVRELADLISMAAGFDAAPASGRAAAEAAWLAAALVIATGDGSGMEEARSALAPGGDVEPLWNAVQEAASEAGLSEQLLLAAESVGFAAPHRG